MNSMASSRRRRFVPRRGEKISGTRIGAALKAAVEAHDKRFPAYKDIVLISDGDDPADDKEWVRGADEARKAEIPGPHGRRGRPVRGLYSDLWRGTGPDAAPRGAAETDRGRDTRPVRCRPPDDPQLGEFFRPSRIAAWTFGER